MQVSLTLSGKYTHQTKNLRQVVLINPLVQIFIEIRKCDLSVLSNPFGKPRHQEISRNKTSQMSLPGNLLAHKD